MKICMVLEFFVPHYNGGGEHRYYEITKRLVQRGHDIDVLTMRVKDVPDFENIDGINVHHIGPEIIEPPLRSGSAFIRYFFSVCNWLRKHDYDIIEGQAYSPLLSSVLMAKLKRTPVIGTIHDVSSNYSDQWVQSSRMANMAEKFFADLPYDKLITVSEMTRDSLINDFGAKKERVTMIPNGVDISKIDSVADQEKDEDTIIFVGRIIPHKHVDHLVEVVKRLKDDIPNIKLVIVGKGIEKENIIKQIKDDNLEDNVELLQDLSDENLIIQMKKANVLVLPSMREGFGMVLAEANACKTPVVAYSTGGVLSVVIDNYNGLLVEPMNVDLLTQKVKNVLTDRKLQERLAMQGRKRVIDKFNWDEITSEYIKVAKSIMK